MSCHVAWFQVTFGNLVLYIGLLDAARASRTGASEGSFHLRSGELSIAELDVSMKGRSHAAGMSDCHLEPKEGIVLCVQPCLVRLVSADGSPNYDCEILVVLVDLSFKGDLVKGNDTLRLRVESITNAGISTG